MIIDKRRVHWDNDADDWFYYNEAGHRVYISEPDLDYLKSVQLDNIANNVKCSKYINNSIEAELEYYQKRCESFERFLSDLGKALHLSKDATVLDYMVEIDNAFNSNRDKIAKARDENLKQKAVINILKREIQSNESRIIVLTNELNELKEKQVMIVYKNVNDDESF